MSPPYPVLTLKEEDLTITPETTLFLKRALGKDLTDDQIRNILVETRESAYKTLPYPCIRQFHFVSFFMQRNAIYKRVVKNAQKGLADKPPVVLDLGCCMGTDLRKLIQDGFPTNSSTTNIYGCDLLPEFIEAGYNLYKDRPDSNSPTPIKFFADDIFGMPLQPDNIEEPGFHGLKSLRGKVDILYAGALFHLFDEEQQFDLAKRLAVLANTNQIIEPKSSETIIFGRHIGNSSPTKGKRPSEFGGAFCHSPSSWKELWETVFVQAHGEKVLQYLEVDGFIEDLIPGSTNENHKAWLWWSVVVRQPL